MDEQQRAGGELQATIQRLLRHSLHLWHVNAGSCNACESELAALLMPPYDLQRYGIELAASPHHADMLVVTGPVTRHLHDPLLRAYEAMPSHRMVVALGACACTGGVYHAAYAVLGPLDRVLPVDLYIPGCPPHPLAILHGLQLALGRTESRVRAGSITGET